MDAIDFSYCNCVPKYGIENCVQGWCNAGNLPEALNSSEPAYDPAAHVYTDDNSASIDSVAPNDRVFIIFTNSFAFPLYENFLGYRPLLS